MNENSNSHVCFNHCDEVYFFSGFYNQRPTFRNFDWPTFLSAIHNSMKLIAAEF